MNTFKKYLNVIQEMNESEETKTSEELFEDKIFNINVFSNKIEVKLKILKSAKDKIREVFIENNLLTLDLKTNNS